MAVFATLTYAVAALLVWAQIASAFVAVPSNFAISAPHGLVRRLAESAPNRDRRSSSRDTSKRRDPSSRDSGGDGAGNAPRKDMRNGGAGYKGPSGSFDRGKKSPSQESAFEKLSSSERLQKARSVIDILGSIELLFWFNVKFESRAKCDCNNIKKLPRTSTLSYCEDLTFRLLNHSHVQSLICDGSFRRIPCF